MRFRLDSAIWLPPLARKCLRDQERGRLNTSGEFILTSERTRTQSENFQDCIDKLFEMIIKACELPKATEASKVERIKKLSGHEETSATTRNVYGTCFVVVAQLCAACLSLS